MRSSRATVSSSDSRLRVPGSAGAEEDVARGVRVPRHEVVGEARESDHLAGRRDRWGRAAPARLRAIGGDADPLGGASFAVMDEDVRARARTRKAGHGADVGVARDEVARGAREGDVRPLPEMEGVSSSLLAPLPREPSEATLTRSVTLVSRSRTKTSVVPFVSPVTRFAASLAKATSRAALETAGALLPPLASVPCDEMLTRLVTPAATGEDGSIPSRSTTIP